MFRISLLAVPFFLLAIPALADDTPPPDKSGYTLFNPVPDNLMRPFTTDRPAKSNTPTTVDAGHFQYEGDIINWSYDSYNISSTTNSNILLFDPTLKLGLTQNTDLEFAIAPVNVDYIKNRATAERESAFGFGDIYTRVKFNLFGNEGGTYALAFVPYVKAPTADHHIGNSHWEGGGYAPFSIALPDDWSVTFQTEFDILENNALDGMHPNYQNLVNFTRPITGNVTGEVEFWSDVNTDRAAPSTQYTLDLAAFWSVNANFQLDAGANIGLNKAAPDLQLYAGISRRF